MNIAACGSLLLQLNTRSENQKGIEQIEQLEPRCAERWVRNTLLQNALGPEEEAQEGGDGLSQELGLGGTQRALQSGAQAGFWGWDETHGSSRRSGLSLLPFTEVTLGTGWGS